jgi:hypothetical protein
VLGPAWNTRAPNVAQPYQNLTVNPKLRGNYLISTAVVDGCQAVCRVSRALCCAAPLV